MMIPKPLVHEKFIQSICLVFGYSNNLMGNITEEKDLIIIEKSLSFIWS